ncbi:MAG: hypothetical protein PUC06_12145 [Oscillospiraceae bacterium]|nr:hypothetical protein [Oscillospiraceae bacterium]
MNDEMQQALLLSQIQKKRTLKDRYLYGSELEKQPKPAEESAALTGMVLANLIAFSIREHKNIFALMDDLQNNPGGQNLFDSVLRWIEVFAEVLDLGVYELFVDDSPRRRKIVYGLLAHLRQDTPENWTEIHTDESGSVAFSLPDFDTYWPMTAPTRHEIMLMFQREPGPGGMRYRLMMGSAAGSRSHGLLPDHGLLWEESAGELADFMERTISDLQGGWFLLQKGFESRRKRLTEELETLRDLAAVLEEYPGELKGGSIFEKEARVLEKLREETRQDYARMPTTLKEETRGREVRGEILLLGGAIKSLLRAAAEPDQAKSALTEAVYLLEGLLQTGGAKESQYSDSDGNQ